MYSLDHINELAGDAGMTSYDGDYQETYTGLGDDFVDFGGKALDFASEIASDRIFSITVNNAGAYGGPITVLLTPSYIPSIAGNVVRDGGLSGAASVVCSGAPKTIAEFIAFIGRNPTAVVAMKVRSTHAEQLAQTINITRKSPFATLGSEQINLESFTTEIANNDKMVTVRRPFQIDDQTEVSVVVPQGATTTFTFYCGAVLNTAKALHSKSNRAGKNVKVASSRAMVAAAK